MMGGEWRLSARTNSIPIVKTTVVRRNAVYMGTETPLMEAMPTTCGERGGVTCTDQ